jgi:uncharacterized protein YeaO (DUF488 family)
MIRTKSVYSPIDRRNDGLRVLVTRFRGRGLPKSRCDIWMANLGPSEQLLRAFTSGKLTWAAFGRQYRCAIATKMRCIATDTSSVTFCGVKFERGGLFSDSNPIRVRSEIAR